MEGGDVSEKETQNSVSHKEETKWYFTPLLSCGVSLHNCPVHKDSPITIYIFLKLKKAKKGACVQQLDE